MKASFKAFMQGIIDYAGLYPPADLSLDTSIQKYSKYRKSEDSWMLSRYIIPARRLVELEPYGENVFKEGGAFDFSVLGKGTETVSEYQQHLQEIVASLEQFHATHGYHVKTDVLEIKLPREVVFANDPALLSEIYEETAQSFAGISEFPNQVYFEGIFDKNWKKEIALILETLNEHNRTNQEKNNIQSGFKLRCGGVEASMFPSVEQVAFALNNARTYNVMVKGTAGLHHPIRHYSHSVKTKMHGFINVFGGAMLSYAHNFSDEQLMEVLKEEDHEHFEFTNTGFRWNDFEISADEIVDLREVALISFGSCSFDEPREDLKQLGLL